MEGVIIASLVLFVALVLPLVLIAMYYSQQKKVAIKTSYVSDRDIIKHIDSAEGRFTTSQELAEHFGLTKSEMNSRLNALKAVHVFKSYSNGIRTYHQLRRPLPEDISESYDRYLDENRIYELFDKYDNVLTLPIILVESGAPLKEATQLLKRMTKAKILSRISDFQGDRKYVLAAKYRHAVNSNEVADQSDLLDLDVLNLVDNHGGSISIDELAEDTGLDQRMAREHLELMTRKELLKMTLDGNGRSAYSKRH